MGISGILKEIGPGERIALVKVASEHFVTNQRPLRLAIDIQIWLFQIQSGKGGSNPAVRTFYYRLLRLLSLNIHPLFVFDGPNKPTFKRNKRVGGPGVKVATVPEILAKQLMNAFGFPWRIAPGEAEAECALLQREGIVDAVLSDDVDTLMFGSGLTIRNWTPEHSSKTPTHVNLYRAEKTLHDSGLDREGMILVALMSGGDYVVEGIPGCGPKFACSAARAGFGKELCEIAKRRDVPALKQWRERLQHEICTNESKLFSRRNTKLIIPDDFPNREVLGYYTDPCISTPETLERLRNELKWDQDIDFASLRIRVGEIFDWLCLGGAKKFIRNLAPAMLVRNLRLTANSETTSDEQTQREKEERFVQAIHGKRNHVSTDNELEYRISFIPAELVPIDLSTEDPDDDFVPAGGIEDPMEAEDEWAVGISGTQAGGDPASPTKKRQLRPWDPSEPEKIWIMRTFLVPGCPLMVETFESPKDARTFLQEKRRAKARSTASRPKPRNKEKAQMPNDALLAYTKVVKAVDIASELNKQPAKVTVQQADATSGSAIPEDTRTITSETLRSGAMFRLPSTQAAPIDIENWATGSKDDVSQLDDRETGQIGRQTRAQARTLHRVHPPAPTPSRQRKRRSPEPCSPRPLAQKTMDAFWSPSFRKAPISNPDVIDLVSSPVKESTKSRPVTPSPQPGGTCLHLPAVDDFFAAELPDTVTKRRKRTPLRRYMSAPACGDENDLETDLEVEAINTPVPFEIIDLSTSNALDLASPIRVVSRPSPSVVRRQSRLSNDDRVESAPGPATISNKENEVPSVNRINDVQLKRLIRIRDSLPGSWTEVLSTQENLEKISAIPAKATKGLASSRWQAEDIEILDLT